MMVQQSDKFRSGQRFAAIIALIAITAYGLKIIKLFLIFDSLGQQFQPQALPQLNNSANHFTIDWAMIWKHSDANTGAELHLSTVLKAKRLLRQLQLADVVSLTL